MGATLRTVATETWTLIYLELFGTLSYVPVMLTCARAPCQVWATSTLHIYDLLQDACRCDAAGSAVTTTGSFLIKESALASAH